VGPLSTGSANLHQPTILERGRHFFYSAYDDGWRGLVEPLAGYLCSLQRLVALVARLFSPTRGPAIYDYTAVFLTLLIIWLATSPRLDMPLLGIAVVVVPRGYEVLGNGVAG
jgi:hypothetical protein